MNKPNIVVSQADYLDVGACHGCGSKEYLWRITIKNPNVGEGFVTEPRLCFSCMNLLYAALTQMPTFDSRMEYHEGDKCITCGQGELITTKDGDLMCEECESIHWYKSPKTLKTA